jgi:WD40 repeat protein
MSLAFFLSLPIAIMSWDEATAEKDPMPIAIVEVKNDEPIVFDKHVYPILEAKCTTCHDREGGLAEGGIDLLTAESITKGGKHGAGVVAGKSDESLLFKLASHRDKPIMPPADEGEPLTGEELSLLKQWIDQGAKPGENLSPASTSKKSVTLGTLSPHIQAVEAIDISPDGKWLAAGRANQVIIHDVSEGKSLATLSNDSDLVHAVAVTPDGMTIAAGGYEQVKLWKRKDGANLTEWEETKSIGPIKERVLAVAFSPDGQLLAVGGGVPSASGEASVWRVADQSQVWIKPEVHSDTICAVAFSPDGKMIATASSDKFLRVLLAENGNTVKSFEGHTGHVLSVGWNADGKQLATASADHAAKLWNFESGEQERTLEGHSKEITCIRYVPSKGLLVTTCGDRVARLIKADNGQVVRVLEGAKDYLLSCDVSADGNTVAAGSQNGEIYLWNVDDGKLRATIPAPQTPAVSQR